ncbi:MAG: hypothetical protein AAGE52_28940 [Myxococcota bacterium]
MRKLCVLVGLITTSGAAAQEMGQGEANITARADVRMALESGPATNGTKLSLIGGTIGSRLTEVRRCYRTRTEERPDIQGELRLVVRLEAGGGTVEVTRDLLEDETLVRCVLRALRAATLSQVRPPGTAFVTLTFSNTAAAGVEATRQRREQEEAVPVETNADGRLEARGQTEIGEVRFRVVGRRNATEAQIQAVHRGVRAAIPSFLDCRRKAARRYPPYGEIRTAVNIARSGRARARVRRSTVRDVRGERCVTRTLQRARFDGEARGAVDIIVEFAHREGDAHAPTEP